jgi:chromosome segregation ATPase
MIHQKDDLINKLTVQDVRIDELSNETTSLATVRDVVHQRCHESVDKVNELEGALRVAKQQVNKWQTMFACKEAELKRLTSAINGWKRQLCLLLRSDKGVNNSNNECGMAAVSSDTAAGESLETELANLKKRWNEIQDDLIYHKSCIADLTGKELIMKSQLDQQSARVTELEAVIQSQGVSNKSLSRMLDKSRSSIGILRSDLEATKLSCSEACNEVKIIEFNNECLYIIR